MRSTACRAIWRTLRRSSAAALGTPRVASPFRWCCGAILAGALVAFLQAMTLFGSPAILAIPAGYHTMTTKIWSLFQYPPKPELAAAASLPLLVLTVLLLRAEHMILGRRSYSCDRRQELRPAHHPARLAALGGARLLLRRAAQSRCFCRTARCSTRRSRRSPRSFIWFDNFTFQNIHFVFYELSATKLALYNTFVLGISTATIGTVIAVVIAYLTTREAVTGHRAPRLPRHRAGRHSRHRARRRPVFSATRGRRSCSTARCGYCWRRS